jgi:hypothetical protein
MASGLSLDFPLFGFSDADVSDAIRTKTDLLSGAIGF